MYPNSNFKELLRIFNERGVKYLVVGGYAAMLYTEPRFTKDLDVWVEPTIGNARQVHQRSRRSALRFPESVPKTSPPRDCVIRSESRRSSAARI